MYQVRLAGYHSCPENNDLVLNRISSVNLWELWEGVGQFVQIFSIFSMAKCHHFPFELYNYDYVWIKDPRGGEVKGTEHVMS